jgi:protein SCO1/2
VNKRIYIIIGAIIIAAIVVLMVYIQSQQSPKLVGTTVFNPPLNTSDFILYDTNGNKIELNQLYGKVIAMSFVYRNCPDVCPIIMKYFKQVADELNKEGYKGKYIMLLISVDPDRDAIQAKSFMEEMGMPDDVHYLVSPKEELQNVWKAYGVFVEIPTNKTGNYTVTHTAITYVIDKQLRIRVAFGHPGFWSPNDLLQDMIILIKE